MGGPTTGSLQGIKLPIPVPILHLTRKKFREACKTATPEIEALLAEEGSTWGPKYVRTRVLNTMNGAVYEKTFGRFQPWQNAWGPQKNFDHIARAKVWASYVHKMDTRDLTDQFVPKVMRDKDNKPYVGGIYRNGFSTGTSGAYGPVDHQIDEIVNFHLVANELKNGCRFMARCEMYSSCPDCEDDDAGSEVTVEIYNDLLYLVRMSDDTRSQYPFDVENSGGNVKLTGGNEFDLDILRITKSAA